MVKCEIGQFKVWRVIISFYKDLKRISPRSTNRPFSHWFLPKPLPLRSSFSPSCLCFFTSLYLDFLSFCCRRCPTKCSTSWNASARRTSPTRGPSSCAWSPTRSCTTRRSPRPCPALVVTAVTWQTRRTNWSLVLRTALRSTHRCE